MILANQEQEEDDTLTLRLAIENNSKSLFFLLWENYGHLFTEHHLLTLFRFMVHQ
jgi:hypothetical protein